MTMGAPSRSGRIVGDLAAAVLLVLGWTSFVLAILIVALVLAAASAYLGIRYDRSRNRPDPN